MRVGNIKDCYELLHYLAEHEDLDITWWVEIFIPIVCLIVLIEIIVISWAGMI